MRFAIPALLLLLQFTSDPALAGKRNYFAGPVQAEVLRVIDGDTLEVRASIWLGQVVETLVRVAGIDAPEMKAGCARERRHARRAQQHLTLLAGREVSLSKIRKDKYGGRVLAQVSSADSRDIASVLLAQGFVRPYRGRARQGWCDAPEQS